jgi:hypothetical protein
MEIYRIKTTSKKYGDEISVQVFNDPIEVNECVNKLSENKAVGIINDYDMHKINNIARLNAGDLLNHMTLGDFVKLLDELKNPTLKIF